MSMVSAWPLVIIAILVAPATPLHKQDSVDKRYSNAPKVIRLKFDVRPPSAVSQDASKKSLQPIVTFTQKLLHLPDTQVMLRGTIGSAFIQEMVKGTLTDEQFRAFLMQDAHYLSRWRDILRETRDRIAEIYPQFADIYNIQAGKYDTAYQSILKTLNKQDVDDVMISPAIAEYEQFLTELSRDQPRHLAIGFLPCSQSFRFISAELMSEVQGSPFKEWFQSNYRPPGYESDLEKFINRKAAKEGIFTENDIPSIYLEGMRREENFIEAAGTGL